MTRTTDTPHNLLSIYSVAWIYVRLMTNTTLVTKDSIQHVWIKLLYISYWLQLSVCYVFGHCSNIHLRRIVFFNSWPINWLLLKWYHVVHDLLAEQEGNWHVCASTPTSNHTVQWLHFNSITWHQAIALLSFEAEKESEVTLYVRI